ncbi:hypothetical protein E3N88_40738 [Mikania micrantha]|uniref:Uncharacterized protein n=1 Tax=Mikania micrantha TaxID=192012 RepID=A0A5N6LPG8_9ASTR|nr:hypothetical protein E3N88_40738 [Mikania micrantha]
MVASLADWLEGKDSMIDWVLINHGPTTTWVETVEHLANNFMRKKKLVFILKLGAETLSILLSFELKICDNWGFASDPRVFVAVSSTTRL